MTNDQSPYAHPEVLVSTDWVKARLDDPAVRLVEVDVDTAQYAAGHIPGAIGFNWQTQLQDQVRRDIIGPTEFARLCSGAGIGRDHTVILYGDNFNWFAAYAFWLFKLFGHRDARLMNGGRVKWLNEDDKPLTAAPPAHAPTDYIISEGDIDHSLRAKLADVFAGLDRKNINLVDVRSADEFTGRMIAPSGQNESAQRGGHIPTAKNIPWSAAVNPLDGTFRPLDELKAIYLGDRLIDPARPTITYCRIGERSSHTWFVLTYLLGLDHCKNYDGSWTEYGNLIAAPIER